MAQKKFNQKFVNLTIGEVFELMLSSNTYDVEEDDNRTSIIVGANDLFKEDSVEYNLLSNSEFSSITFVKEIDEDDEDDVTYIIEGNDGFRECYAEDYSFVDAIVEDILEKVIEYYTESFEALKERVDEYGEDDDDCYTGGDWESMSNIIELYADELGIEYEKRGNCMDGHYLYITKFDGDIKNLFV